MKPQLTNHVLPFGEHRQEQIREIFQTIFTVVNSLPLKDQGFLVSLCFDVLPQSNYWTPYLFGGDIMATQRKDFQWDFVVTNLSDIEKEAFADYSENKLEDLIPILTEVLSQGYKMSARLDVEKDVWIIALSGTDFSSYNAKTTFVSRHHTLDKALLLMCFKNDVLSNGGAWRNDKDQAEWG